MTIHSFRKIARAEETIMRAMMPRTSAADPAPLPAFANDGVPAKVRWVAGRRFVQKSGFTLAEVAHVA